MLTCHTMWTSTPCQQTTSSWCRLQQELEAGAGASQQDTSEDGSDTESEDIDKRDKELAGEEEDVSQKWDAQKQQQAIEVLLGSCAGSDFVQSADPPQVHS